MLACNMRILVFSDTHLTDKFDQKKFDFLSNIIDESDQVIINGDFYDGYIVSFDEFVKSEWSRLFSKLKKKKTAYLFGNHDKEEFVDHRVNNFSETQQYSLSIKTRGRDLVIEHGNRYLHFIDEKVNLKNIPKSFARHALSVENFLVRNFGTKLIEYLYKTYNEQIKRKLAKDIKEDQIYVCGHTHLAEIDLGKGFLNTGVVGYGLGQYLLIENEEILDREVWYDTPALEGAIEPSLYIDQSEYINTKQE